MKSASTYYRMAREMRKINAIRERLSQPVQETRTETERATDAELEALAMYIEFLATEI